MGKIWNIQTLLCVTFWFASACSTEPEQHEIKTVDSQNVTVSEDDSTSTSKKPKIRTNKTSEDAKSKDSDSTSISDQADEGPSVVEEKQIVPVDLNFTWDAPTETDIISYKIYTKTEDQVENLLSEIMIGNLNLTAPSFTYELSEKEQMDWAGQTVYFSIVASNATGDSEKSIEIPFSFE